MVRQFTQVYNAHLGSIVWLRAQLECYASEGRSGEWEPAPCTAA